MEKIFDQYGGVIITVIVVVALIVIANALANGTLSGYFEQLMTSFFQKAQGTIKGGATGIIGVIR